jgi:beta-glucosidase
MTLEEKCDYIGGSKDGFYIRPVERLGIPLIRMADGPQGVRNNTRSTLFACGVAAAASWNEDVAYEMGVALGQDSRARGVHILLGPGVNICRSPLCGRNFEYMGEDPCLAAATAVGYIKGVQSQGVMATVKHFALNNQEFNRHHVSSDADERTINEIYFPAFKAAVDAGVASVMSSYNLVNNVHSAENRWLLTETLR